MKYNNTHKLIVVKNGRTLNYVFSYRTEEEKLDKLKQWKSENISPYDKVTLLFNGSLEEHEELIRPCFSHALINNKPKSKLWKVYAKIMQFVKSPMKLLFSKENICNIENID